MSLNSESFIWLLITSYVCRQQHQPSWDLMTLTRESNRSTWHLLTAAPPRVKVASLTLKTSKGQANPGGVWWHQHYAGVCSDALCGDWRESWSYTRWRLTTSAASSVKLTSVSEPRQWHLLTVQYHLGNNSNNNNNKNSTTHENDCILLCISNIETIFYQLQIIMQQEVAHRNTDRKLHKPRRMWFIGWAQNS